MYRYGNNEQKKMHSSLSNRFANKMNKIANSVLPHDKNKSFLSNHFFNGQVIRNVLQEKTCHAKT